jgi:hypothetical protein
MTAPHWSRSCDSRLQFLTPTVFISSSTEFGHLIAGVLTRRVACVLCAVDFLLKWCLSHFKRPASIMFTVTGSCLNYIECSFCRLIRRPGSFLESLIGRTAWQSPANWRLFIRRSLDQCSLESPSVTEGSWYCALFCLYGSCEINLQQRVFIFDCYVKTNLYKSCRRTFRR